MHKLRFLFLTFLGFSSLACGLSSLPLTGNPTPTPLPPSTLFPTQVPTEAQNPTPITPTLTPTSPPAEPTTHHIDTQNDGISCQTGTPILQSLPPEIDIQSAQVARSEGDATTYEFQVQFGRVSELKTLIRQEGKEFLGGIELFTPTGPTPPTDPDWYFNSTGNISFNFGWNHEIGELFAWKAVYQNGQWEVNDNTFYPSTINGNILMLSIPADEVPNDSLWLVTTTNFAVCDVLGLEAGLPMLPLPR